jgi:hypothetical protein
LEVFELRIPSPTEGCGTPEKQVGKRGQGNGKPMLKRRFSHSLLILFTSMLLLSALSAEPAPLENGFYRVLHTFASETDMNRPMEPSERLLRYNPAFLDAEDKQEEVVVIATDRFVPMQLQEQPEKLPDETDRTMFWLGVSLTPSASELLEAFTRDYLGQRVAVVAGGEVITMHSIKEVIKGGKIQISRCGDRGCEILFQELEDNITPTEP